MATDQQVQTFVNERIRPMAELFRALVLRAADDKSAIADVYEACLPQNNPTWEDSRTDGPPHLLTPNDVLVYNSVITLLAKFVDGSGTSDDVDEFAAVWPIFQQACVRSVL